jgi:hypothetical protein
LTSVNAGCMQPSEIEISLQPFVKPLLTEDVTR